jgi:hypothetical protein
MDSLTNENFLLYAAKHYDNPQCHSTEEFADDMKRFRYIKKLITRYIETGDLKERLILNHVIILNNVFTPHHLVRMLFLKMEKQMPYVKPFLVMLNVLPSSVYRVGKHQVIHTDSVPMDEGIVKALRTV